MRVRDPERERERIDDCIKAAIIREEKLFRVKMSKIIKPAVALSKQIR